MNCIPVTTPLRPKDPLLVELSEKFTELSIPHAVCTQYTDHKGALRRSVSKKLTLIRFDEIKGIENSTVRKEHIVKWENRHV